MAVGSTVIRRASIQRIAQRARALGIVDFFYEEPCIRDLRSQPVASEALDRSHIPGTVLETRQVAALVRRRRVSAEAAGHLVAGRPRGDDEHLAAALEALAALGGFNLNAHPVAEEARLEPSPTLLTIARSIEPQGFVCRVVGPWAAERDLQGPVLALFGGRTVVVLQANAGKALFYEPSRGLVEASADDLAALWSGYGLKVEAVVTDALLEDASRSGLLAFTATLITSLKRYRALALNQFSLELIGSVVRIPVPALMGSLIDQALDERDQRAVVGLAIVACATTLTAMVLDALAAITTTACKVPTQAALQLIGHRQALRLVRAPDDGVGELENQAAYLEHVREFLLGIPRHYFGALLVLGGAVGAVAALSPQIAAPTLGFVAASLAIRYAFGVWAAGLQHRLYDLAARTTGRINEVIGAAQTVKACAAEQVAGGWIEDGILAQARVERRIGYAASTVDLVLGALGSLVRALCLWGIVAVFGRGGASIGSVVAAALYVDMIIGVAEHLGREVPAFVEFKTALGRLQKALMKRPAQVAPEARTSQAVAISGRIALDRVSFSYGEGYPLVLKDVSLTTYPNQIVALVGNSGSGKSTLANLIAGNLRPTSGALFFDEFDVNNLTMSSRRRQVALMGQESVLFSGSIRENVAYGDDEPDGERVWDSLVKANAHQFVTRLPGQLDYHVAAGGVGLSGGQRQRIMIARLLYLNPRVVIFDEATSALDPLSEVAVMEAFKTLVKQRTTILIAHRITTIRAADRVVVLHNGSIADDGSIEELTARPGHFAALFGNPAESA